MSVDAAEPDDGQEPEDEYIADDATPVDDVSADDKRGRGRPDGMTKVESDRLSAEMWEEYASGKMTVAEIGLAHGGLTRQAVWARLRRYRKRLGLEDIDDAKALDLGRLEALMERWWMKAFQNEDPDATKMWLMLMERRAKLLGLDAPKKLQVGGELQITPSPAFIGHLDRIAQERERVLGDIDRRALESPQGKDDGDVVDAEVIDDPG